MALYHESLQLESRVRIRMLKFTTLFFSSSLICCGRSLCAEDDVTIGQDPSCSAPPSGFQRDGGSSCALERVKSSVREREIENEWSGGWERKEGRHTEGGRENNTDRTMRETDRKTERQMDRAELGKAARDRQRERETGGLSEGGNEGGKGVACCRYDPDCHSTLSLSLSLSLSLCLSLGLSFSDYSAADRKERGTTQRKSLICCSGTFELRERKQTHIMASAAPQKRVVSSVFITLASPFRATVTPTAHVHSSPTREQPLRRTSASQDGQIDPPAPASPLRTPAAPDDLPLPPPPPHDPRDPCDPDPGPPAAPAQESAAAKALLRSAPSAGRDVNEPSADVCGFCRKPVPLSEPAIEALNRTYHAACFQCRQCHAPLAAKIYYNKSGIPLCDDCYQASLEPCWACGDVIKDHVIRALERAYHPPCFVCTTCRQPIGEQRFAQGEDGTDSYTVECLGHTYHEDCYRCEVCSMLLSPEPNENGCHPLDGQILCKPCHVSLIQSAPL
ncbi:Filamin-binding LIM protein 1 [Labeo rohita]|uniref:Filamin-binding LIM protein 1 n=1 Tax=Labeo rohita TaxID=84645 RepID=A0ABQ8LAZ9_LABRO|nr:Filamin-binding LIM protein 1 [Labeo rohita]